jgi:hypothetical protein
MRTVLRLVTEVAGIIRWLKLCGSLEKIERSDVLHNIIMEEGDRYCPAQFDFG